jgi:hypothetical protein
MIAWFNSTIETLPLTPLHADGSSSFSFTDYLEDPPIGLTHLRVAYRSIPLRRSGPRGWTYFPASPDGTRLARLSYQSTTPGLYITALVKLVDHEDDGKAITWTVSEYALVTLDNLTSHGRVEMRDDNHPNKRRKLCIRH